MPQDDPKLELLIEALQRVMKTHHVQTWLNTPCAAFDGSKPVEVLERGRS